MDLEKIITYLKGILPEEEIVDKDKYLILPTICHNIDSMAAQKKLYLYKNEDSTPLFHCFTECNETFNIYQFIQKFHATRGEEISYKEAFKLFHGMEYQKSISLPEEADHFYQIQFSSPLKIELPTYNHNCLDSFQTSYTDPWALEGIDLDILKKYNIRYSKSYEGVFIPHYDWRGNLVGLRIRNYNPLKTDSFKYMPAHIGNVFYRHPTSLNFYGLFQNQENIQKYSKARIFESEKAVLQYEQIFNEDNLSLAICGKNISKWHMDILIYYLGVKELEIGFDKEYKTYTEAFNYVEKIRTQTSHLSNFMDIYVLIDNNNKFNLKDSPVDKTKKDFLSLEKWKI